MRQTYQPEALLSLLAPFLGRGGEGGSDSKETFPNTWKIQSDKKKHAKRTPQASCELKPESDHRKVLKMNLSKTPISYTIHRLGDPQLKPTLQVEKAHRGPKSTLYRDHEQRSVSTGVAFPSNWRIIAMLASKGPISWTLRKTVARPPKQGSDRVCRSLILQSINTPSSSASGPQGIHEHLTIGEGKGNNLKARQPRAKAAWKFRDGADPLGSFTDVRGQPCILKLLIYVRGINQCPRSTRELDGVTLENKEKGEQSQAAASDTGGNHGLLSSKFCF